MEIGSKDFFQSKPRPSDKHNHAKRRESIQAMQIADKGRPISLEGIVEEALPALSFRVRMKEGALKDEVVLGHLAGRLRLHHIRVLPGDRVLIELSPDGHRGRITRRL